MAARVGATQETRNKKRTSHSAQEQPPSGTPRDMEGECDAQKNRFQPGRLQAVMPNPDGRCKVDRRLRRGTGADRTVTESSSPSSGL